MRVSREVEKKILKQAGVAAPPAPAKYRNHRFVRDGERWDSEKEWQHGQLLKIAQASCRLAGLRRQVDFPLVVNGVKVCSYRADFVYEEGDGAVVVDVKSPITRKLRDYRIKKKLMLAIWGITIREV